MSQAGKLLYTAKVHTTGGREAGTSRSGDGRLEIKHSVPGAPRNGTNPEQLFAAGWSTCFESAMAIAARKMKAAVSADLAIDAEVEPWIADGDYFLRDQLNMSLLGLDRKNAQSIVNAAEQLCPYSKAVRGDVDVTYTLVANPIHPSIADRGKEP